ncbi:MAG: gamma-glutamylcyclotransferase family protein [Pseudomonadota bacterium]
MRLLYAAYGSNLHPDRLKQRVPTAKLEGTALLENYTLTFDKRGVDGSGKAAVAAGGDGVHVALYSMDTAGKATLDRFEHINIGYYDFTIDLAGFGECFLYTATDAYSVQGLEPYCWYHALVREGSQAHGFPDDYVRAIDAVPRREDPDIERRDANWALVDSLRPF